MTDIMSGARIVHEKGQFLPRSIHELLTPISNYDHNGHRKLNYETQSRTCVKQIVNVNYFTSESQMKAVRAELTIIRLCVDCHTFLMLRQLHLCSNLLTAVSKFTGSTVNEGESSLVKYNYVMDSGGVNGKGLKSFELPKNSSKPNPRKIHDRFLVSLGHPSEAPITSLNIRTKSHLKLQTNPVALKQKFALRICSLCTFPSPHLGTSLDNATFKISTALRLRLAIIQHHGCRMDIEKTASRLHRHRELNNIIYRALISLNMPSVLEPPSVCRIDRKKADGLTIMSCHKGKRLIWDCTLGRKKESYEIHMKKQYNRELSASFEELISYPSSMRRTCHFGQTFKNWDYEFVAIVLHKRAAVEYLRPRRLTKRFSTCPEPQQQLEQCDLMLKKGTSLSYGMGHWLKWHKIENYATRRWSAFSLESFSIILHKGVGMVCRKKNTQQKEHALLRGILIRAANTSCIARRTVHFIVIASLYPTLGLGFHLDKITKLLPLTNTKQRNISAGSSKI
ncbi:hypothetical protein Bhyg_06832 [Pseudolycoriella hygida]|uniref:Uncharacterized protein n=1 Tax=Pseudolycoriella hygida TaxID=35572 RepID=A0A9Q0N1G8_9DIPT|nr:hypothetical protein Bhyg_06832 [Pseudolycoriella hygida]